VFHQEPFDGREPSLCVDTNPTQIPRTHCLTVLPKLVTVCPCIAIYNTDALFYPSQDGEYLVNAQGEDVVAGIRTPEDILTMANALPEAYAGLVKNTQLLEKHYRDMQDIEFTVQEGKLYMLQTRSGKRTGVSAVKIAVDLVQGTYWAFPKS
jgi:hypothetical protein